MNVTTRMSHRQRLLAVLAGEQPDRIPFVDRLEMWHRARVRSGTVPEKYRGMSLIDIHRDVGMGQELFVRPHGFKLVGVEVKATFNDEPHFHEYEPVVQHYPGHRDLVPKDRAGIMRFELRTPVGTIAGEHQTLQEAIDNGEESYLREHLLKDDDDFEVAHWILDHHEYVPTFDQFYAEDAALGEAGFAVAALQQVPFQQVLLEYLGELRTFYLLYDDPGKLKKLIDHIDERLVETLDHLAGLDTPYAEFLDNLTGAMTNPNLFREYYAPYSQRYAEILHAQGKKVGSHTDGDLRLLLDVIPESGLDVCESFSPVPLSGTTFDELWDVWGGREWPIVWGGIPSTYLEPRTPEAEFRAYVEHVLERIGRGRVILGVGDMVMGHNEIDRVRWIAERVEEHELGAAG
jgi:uroporphyrinogen-III decarboxylase